MTIIEQITQLAGELYSKNLAPTEVWLGEQEQQKLLQYMMENYSITAAPMIKIIHGKTRIGNLTVYRAAAQSCLRVGFTVGEKKNLF